MATRVSMSVNPLSRPSDTRHLTGDLPQLHCSGYEINTDTVLPSPVIGQDHLSSTAVPTGKKPDAVSSATIKTFNFTSLKDLHALKKTTREIRAFIKTVKDRRYDLAIDFHGLFKSAVIVHLSRARRKLGYDSMQELSGLFYNEKICENMEAHAVDRYLDFIRHLGGKITNPEFILPIEEENKKRVERLFDANHIDINEPFVAINPVAFWETKLWQDEKFARLADRIVNELGIKVVFTGGNGRKRIGKLGEEKMD